MILHPSLRVFTKVIKWMKPGRALGPDIPMKIFTHGGYVLRTKLFYLVLRMWDNKIIPDDFKNANIITIFKKEERSICHNYCGISLFCIGSKIYKILLGRRLDVVGEVLPESQCGFRWPGGTIDMSFCSCYCSRALPFGVLEKSSWTAATTLHFLGTSQKLRQGSPNYFPFLRALTSLRPGYKPGVDVQ